MDFDIYQISIAIIGGFIAGGINTLVGSGSAITLSILTEVMGLPPNVANGTNRVGVIAQSLTTSTSFYKNGKFDIVFRSKFFVFLITIGAFAGVYVATVISNDAFKEVFKYLMILIFFVILIKPKRWLIKTQMEKVMNPFLAIPIFLALGFYGGFIQMGMGVFFLAVLVLVAKYSIMDSNVVKAFCVGIYTIIIIWYFHYKGLVDWEIGGILAIGQAIGGFVTAEFASKSKNADLWAYRFLVVVVFLIILKLFGIISF